MTSPLAPFANATLTFTVYGSALAAADATTGNVEPVTEAVEFRAFLKAADPKPVLLPGVDRYAQTWRGYAVEPIDARLTVGARGTITVDGELIGGECIVRSLRGPFGAGGIGATLAEALGEAIAIERVW